MPGLIIAYSNYHYVSVNTQGKVNRLSRLLYKLYPQAQGSAMKTFYYLALLGISI